MDEEFVMNLKTKDARRRYALTDAKSHRLAEKTIRGS